MLLGGLARSVTPTVVEDDRSDSLAATGWSVGDVDLLDRADLGSEVFLEERCTLVAVVKIRFTRIAHAPTTRRRQ